MNASKHASLAGQTHGCCSLSVHCQDGTITVEVVDNGPGLPADFNPALNNGLGLSIVCALASQLGGYLDWGGGPTGGARFTLFFPAELPSTDRGK
jgi:signal transduction histidine kinase